jgi:predicted metalloprotease with PDZ domain
MKIVSVRNGSAAETAGLKQDDVLLTIGNRKVTNKTWERILNRYRPNQQVPITVRRDRHIIRTSLTLDAPHNYDYRVEEIPDAPPEVRARRVAWLNG